MPPLNRISAIETVTMVARNRLADDTAGLAGQRSYLAELMKRKQAHADAVDAMAPGVTQRFQQAIDALPQIVAAGIDQYHKALDKAVDKHFTHVRDSIKRLGSRLQLPTIAEIDDYENRQKALKAELAEAIVAFVKPRLEKMAQSEDGLLKKHLIPGLAKVKEEGFAPRGHDMPAGAPFYISWEDFSACTDGLFPRQHPHIMEAAYLAADPKLKAAYDKEREFETLYHGKRIDYPHPSLESSLDMIMERLGMAVNPGDHEGWRTVPLLVCPAEGAAKLWTKASFGDTRHSIARAQSEIARLTTSIARAEADIKAAEKPAARAV